MYLDLSLVPSSSIDIRYLLSRLPEESYSQVAIDYEYRNTMIAPLPEQFQLFKSVEKSVAVQSRATLIIDEPATLQQLSHAQHEYDILAVRPENEKIFHSLCTEYDNYDVICFNMAVKFPFMLKRNPVYEAIRKGKYFQIQYDSLFDEATRVITMTNIINILKAAKGANIIVSSHAGNHFRHRSPFDISALLVTLGMPKHQVLAAMRANPEAVLRQAAHRRFFKGTVKCIPKQIANKLSNKIKKYQRKIKEFQETE